MKKLSTTLSTPKNISDVNETLNLGNSLNQGVTNHYTPLDNIVINVRNFFGSWLGLVVSKGEDGFTLKVSSDSFASPQAIAKIIYNATFDGHTYLYDYIASQGLPELKCVEVGPMNYVAYFCPRDIKASWVPGEEKVKEDKPTKKVKAKNESLAAANVEEAEMFTLVREGFGETEEEELQDTSHQELVELLDNRNKIEAAKKLSDYLANTVKLPDNMYVKATKDVDGHESIAIRLKYFKRRPFGGKVESTVSLMNIYSAGVNAIWVPCFDEQTEYRPITTEETKNLLLSIIGLLGAEETGDPCVWNIPAERASEETKQKEETKEEETTGKEEEPTSQEQASATTEDEK